MFTIDTTRNSELIDHIFKNFALKMVGRSYVKALSKKCENIAWIEKKSCVVELYETTDFWLQKKKFWLSSFFNHFFKKWWIKKWPEPKKSLI